MIHGFVVIDKPAGITSHDVVSRVRRILGTRKVGHTGTLDPFATGVLPIAVNDGTKAIPFLDEGVKCYEAVMQLGVATDTLDMTGKVLRESGFSAVSEPQLLDVFEKFTGPILQIPPMYSAIKQGGQPLYKLARLGQEVERAARPVEIHAIELLAFTSPFVSIRVTCSRGTYVRTLADDIGATLGCGAALKELRRTASGPFAIGAAHTLDSLQRAADEGSVASFSVTPYGALAHLVDIPLVDAGLAKVSCGRSPLWHETTVQAAAVAAGTEYVRLSHNGILVAVARMDERGDPFPDIVLKRVFM
ncbi:MAG: tRNA pseudouridine(55) synthase TruB [Desulfuromonadaceae bacterium]|nr:tRNA pseudouridine(55) synthase TruB [Desulfuromonadaceae bacterium]